MAVIGALSADPPTALTGTATVQVFPLMGQAAPLVGRPSGASLESADDGRGTEMGDASTCINCDRAVSGAEQKFCPACGQPTPVHRIDWHFLGHELEHSVLHMDRGILYSLKELMLRPGHLMRAYLQGQRAKQVKPLLLLMVSAAVVALLGKYLLDGDLLGSAMQAGYAQGRTMGGREGADAILVVSTFEAVKGWINTHLAAFTLILLPFEAASFWLAFRGRGLNYPEWLVVTAFLTVQAFVFMALAILVQRWVPQAQALCMVPMFFYVVFSLVQLFPNHSRGATVLRSVVGLALFLLAQAVLTMLATFAILMMPR